MEFPAYFGDLAKGFFLVSYHENLEIAGNYDMIKTIVYRGNLKRKGEVS